MKLASFLQGSLAVALCALTSWRSPAQQTPAPAASKHSIWEARSGDKTIHLLGSVHFLTEDSYPLAPVIENAFKRAESVAFETDIAALQDPATAIKMLSVAACPAGKQLSDLVEPKLYKQLEVVMEEYGLPVETVAGFRPWFAAMTLSLFELQKMGFKPEHGVDQHYFKLAKESGKQLIALETVETQTSMFGEMSGADETQLLQQTLNDARRMRQMFKDLVTAWNTGDSGALDKLLNDAMKEAPKVYDRLLLQRNKSWIPAIERMIQTGRPAIVIVGTGHLVGKGSVVDLLRQKGYTVTQR
ncbi:MAG: TraB/GumN family protein [Verrucomicrobia bacterium]|nr:TraB/GumN family protein [Verrucomicrobiota bacterium]